MARKTLSLDSLVESKPAPEAVQGHPAEDQGEHLVAKTTKGSKGSKPSYRENKRAFTAWAHTSCYKELKLLAVNRETTVQALLEEGMDMVFRKYGYDGYDKIAKQ